MRMVSHILQYISFSVNVHKLFIEIRINWGPWDPRWTLGGHGPLGPLGVMEPLGLGDLCVLECALGASGFEALGFVYIVRVPCGFRGL